MTMEVDSDFSCCDDLWELTGKLATEHGADWLGRIVTREDAMLCRREIEESLFNILDTWEEVDDPSFDRLAAQLIWAGTLPSERVFLDREIHYLVTGKDEIFIQQAGLKKSTSKFWHKHKKAIIITAVVIIVVVTVVVVVSCTGGTAGVAAAGGGGGALLADLCNESGEEEKSHKPPGAPIHLEKPIEIPSSQEILQLDPPEIHSNVLSPTQQLTLNGFQDYSSNLSEFIPKPKTEDLESIPQESFPLGSSQFTAPLPNNLQPKSIEAMESSLPAPSLFQHGRSLPPVIDEEIQRSLDSLYPKETPTQALLQGLCNHLTEEFSDKPLQNPGSFIQNVDFVKLEELLKNPTPNSNRQVHEYVDSLFPLNESFAAIPEETNVYDKRPGESLNDALQRIAAHLKEDQKTAFPPFTPQPLECLGDPNGSTIHFHCGINNSEETTGSSGACLRNSLDHQFSVQPHWIHQDNLVHGATMVGLEKLEKIGEENQALTPILPIVPLAGAAAGAILSHSAIQKSIDYEKELVSNMAKEILEQKNDKLKQVHIVFSNAGYVMNETIKQLPQEYKDTMIVIAVGPTTILNDDLGCHKVYNIVGDKDWPSKLCNGGDKGLREAEQNADIKTIKQTETEPLVGGHYFVQQDYQKEIKKVMEDNVIGQYEIY